METLGEQELWSFFDNRPDVQRVKNSTQVRKGPGHEVGSFMELATKVAELQFRNREHILMFRGQQRDFRNSERNTSLKPSLFRPHSDGRLPHGGDLERRFAELQQAEQMLIESYRSERILGLERLTRQRILRWAILQHYEVCLTPLLDVTHSLRIAASFASWGKTKEAFLFVLAVPNLSGAITASAEAGLQIVRLASVCPPSAVRPHIQEGYLLGEYPEMTDYSQKELYGHSEIDFGRRLLAKFRFDPRTFWCSTSFPKVGERALYPPKSEDPLLLLAEEIKRALLLIY